MKKNAEILEPIERQYDQDNREDKESYDSMLNETYGTVSVAGYEYDTARALYLLDETAYNTGFNDYIDTLPKRWECPICGEIHEDDDNDTAKDAAKWCCQTEPEEN